MAGPEPVAARRGGKAVQCAPGDLAEGVRVAVPGQRRKRGDQIYGADVFCAIAQRRWDSAITARALLQAAAVAALCAALALP